MMTRDDLLNQYTPPDFMTPTKEYLESFPWLNPGESIIIDYLNVDPQNPEPFPGRGSAVTVVGGTSTKSGDILDIILLDYQVDMMLILRRHVEENEFRRDLGDLLIQYRMWLDLEEVLRNTEFKNPLLPKFGDTDVESITANGGTQTGIALQQGVDEYSLQVHLRFQKEYQIY